MEEQYLETPEEAGKPTRVALKGAPEMDRTLAQLSLVNRVLVGIGEMLITAGTTLKNRSICNHLHSKQVQRHIDVVTFQ